ncbi:MAG: isocitrate lyase/phosphoenolpyruvate mutase family protein [Paracoccaceae bacterium]|nr:isocitrate lyase/phosphoenolpyruvate mutase family protein [Paracoccaceae bacterium]
MTSRAAKAEAFRALHVPGSPFVIPNPWDRGSARMLAGLGAKALATTSSGYAFTLGLPDGGHVSRDAMLAHCADIVGATDLPVSADLENCYGEAPEVVAETVRLAAEAGLAGCSVEDTALPGNDAYAFDLAVERVRAAVAAARALGFPFTLTARADGVLTRSYDAAEALPRLAAFAEAGADVLYAPLLPMEDQAKAAALGKPVNALAAGKFAQVTLAEFAAAGVARISVGGGLSRLAYTAVRDTARAMFGPGDFLALGTAMGSGEAEEFLAAGTPASGTG